MKRTLRRRIKSLVKLRTFWIVTGLGNTLVLLGAICFHLVERGQNPAVGEFIDSLSWAVSIVTTVGSSNVYPITVAGKILGILMMMGGALFLWSYMALFIGILIEPELSHLGREVSEIQHEVHDLTSAKQP